jgi:hypothetical protein
MFTRSFAAQTRHRRLFVACLISLGLISTPLSVLAASTTFLSGVVTTGGHPAAGVRITATGNNTVAHATADANGRFTFSTLAVGTYVVDARSDAGEATEHIDLSSDGANLSLDLEPKEIGNTTVVAHARSPLHGSGTDLTLNNQQITRLPNNGDLPEALIQLPGAARGANGVVHINGDHGDVNYIVDGIPVPQALNRSIGAEFDLNNIAFMEVLEGAYPAQYGDRFASVLNIDTKTGAGPAGLSGNVEAGSYANLDTSLTYHAPVGKGSLVLSTHNERTDRAEDPPDFNSPHNKGSDATQLLRYTLPNGNDSFNFTLTHSFRTFQIPNDTTNGDPAATDDNERQDDTFAGLQYQHAINNRSSISYGAGFKRSQIRDFGDPENDFAYGEANYLNNGGTSSDCAGAVSSGNFSPTTCGYSLSSDKTAYDYIVNTDYVLRTRAHEIRAGGSYDLSNVDKHYAVTLQPNNFLAPIFTPNTPNAPYAVADNAPNVGTTETAYLQDSWKMGSMYQLDYGLRADAFQITSTGAFNNGFSQFSPRVKLTRNFGSRANIYAYYGRFFTPFSFENVSPIAAQQLNLPLQQGIAAFDLKPQRDSTYELGGHLPVGPGDVGLRIMQKNAADLIDDTQVGLTYLHQDINYQIGRIATQSLYYQVPLKHQGRIYISANHTYSKNKGCETQLLAPCFGSPADWTPADHEQPWGATTGFLLNDTHGGWYSFDGEYGSGLSSALCPTNTPGFCKETPHLTFDAEKGIGLGHDMTLTMRIRNFLNDRYYVTILNAQGNHFAAPRTFDVGLRFGK